MKIAMPTVVVTEGDRRVVACYFGNHNQLASRETMRDWLEMYGENMWDDATYQHQQCEVCHPENVDKEP